MAQHHSDLPTMEAVMKYLEQQSGPVSKRDLSRAFGLKGESRVQVKKMIRDLRDKGLIHTSQKGRKMVRADALPDRMVVEITGMDSLGDLVARPLEWTVPDQPPQILITRDRLSPPAGVGDIVQAELHSMGNRIYHGTALRRVTARENQMVGVYENGQVYSVDRRLKQAFELTDIPRGQTVKNKDILIVEIPLIRERNPQARFVRKLGGADEAFSPTLIAIYMHHLPVAFTEAAEKQVARVRVPKADKSRKDFQSIPFVTIDGADARDFDDAVWAEPDEKTGGWHIMVGIADVAWYVRPGTALDADARLRGNSVYFPDRVLPMLPEELSNGVCSLKPNEPRAALVCEVWIDKNGYKSRHMFHRALIRSVRRLTYTEVQAAMDGRTPIVGLEQEIQNLTGAYLSLKKAREKRGVLEIDVPERQVVLNKNGQVTDVRFREQIPSMQLIEEMMILANVSAAETLEDNGAMTMYRVHDRPSPEKTDNLTDFLKSLGIQARLSETPDPTDFNAILKSVASHERYRAVNELVLRAQSQAVYSPENIGHFGLALSRYAHFTSPIRRYADILVHRALIKSLKLGEGGLTPDEEAVFEDTAHHISYTERQAAAAEMDAVDRYMALFLKDKIGQAFTATISSVNPFGLFLNVEPYGASGFVPFNQLTGDYYEYDEPAGRLIGRATGATFTIGDTVRAVLKECEPVSGSLLFGIVSKGKSVTHTSQKQFGVKGEHTTPKKRRHPIRHRRHN